MTSRRNLLAATLICCLAGAAFAQTPAPVRVRGTIDSVNAQTMVVTSREGQKVTLAVAPDVGVTAILAASIADIKPGSYIGTAAMPQEDGSLLAFEIQIFPESMRGVGEGHRPWDLQPQSTMTNGTVGTVTGSSDRTLTITYAGGEKTVAVAANTPIVTYEPGSPALLVPGAHIILFGNQAPDGKVTATRISVGKDGLVPPM
jgi:hypothetical protein